MTTQEDLGYTCRCGAHVDFEEHFRFLFIDHKSDVHDGASKYHNEEKHREHVRNYKAFHSDRVDYLLQLEKFVHCPPPLAGDIVKRKIGVYWWMQK